MREPRLIVLGGLPGVGKTTLARGIASRTGAVLVRVDTIEAAVRRVAGGLAGPEGYVIGAAIAAENLRLGRDVIADAVNPLALTRMGWRRAGAGARLVEIELACGDAAEHRARVEGRGADIEGLAVPDWAAVMARDHAPWPEAWRVETAGRSVEAVLAEVLGRLDDED
ncbi:AAA family ATPase [soil metagenome]